MSVPFDRVGVDPEALVLADFLDRVLERVVSVYQSFNVSVPDRRYWGIGSGQAPHDCEQLVVRLQTLNLGIPGDESVASPQQCNGPTTATFSVSVVRRSAMPGSTGRAPSAEKIQEYSVAPTVDAWLLHKSLRDIDVYEDGSPGQGVIASTRMLAAQGDYHGVELLVSMVVS